MSWLPVPRSPVECQVAMMLAASWGNVAKRVSMAPSGRWAGSSPSMTMTPAWYQSAWTHPLLNGRLPSRTSWSPSRRARPSGANMLVDTTSAAPSSFAFAAVGSSQARKPVELPMSTVQPADPSPARPPRWPPGSRQGRARGHPAPQARPSGTARRGARCRRVRAASCATPRLRPPWTALRSQHLWHLPKTFRACMVHLQY